MKKIGVVSFRYEAIEFKENLRKTKNYLNNSWSRIPTSEYSEFNRRRIKEISEIAMYAKESAITHLVFPGNTLLVNRKNYSNDSFEEQIDVLAQILKDFAFIIEVSYRDEKNKQFSPPIDTGILCFNKGKEIGERIQQLFAESGEDEFYYKRLWAETNWGHRIKELQGIKFLIWVCGEINFLKCNEKLNYKPEPRYNFKNNANTPLKKIDYDVFFNPAHTPMSRVRIVQNKLEYLSKPKKIAIHTTNAPSFQKSTKRALYCYKDGKSILYQQKDNWPKNKSWIIETVGIN